MVYGKLSTLLSSLLCYVRENIQYKRRLDLETDLELIWLEIFFSGSKNLLVCFFYRPPDSKSSWLDMFSDHLENVYDECKELLLLGDMNNNLLNSDDNNSASPHKLMHVLNSVNLVQVITKPTRVTSKSKTIIDHIYTSNPDYHVMLLVITTPCVQLEDMCVVKLRIAVK